MKTIEIFIDPQGGVKIQTQGFTGASCTDATRALEAALGEKLTDQRTGEYYQAQGLTQEQRTQI